MNWIVLWQPAAEDDLTHLWLGADDKASITTAANRIDAQLQKDPLAIGESRDKNRRVHFDGPLGILFCVYAANRLVHVLRIWRIASSHGK